MLLVIKNALIPSEDQQNLQLRHTHYGWTKQDTMESLGFRNWSKCCWFIGSDLFAIKRNKCLCNKRRILIWWNDYLTSCKEISLALIVDRKTNQKFISYFSWRFFLDLFYYSYSDSKGLRIDLRTRKLRSLRKGQSLR